MAIFLMLLGLMVAYEVFRKFRVSFNHSKIGQGDSPERA